MVQLSEEHRLNKILEGYPSAPRIFLRIGEKSRGTGSWDVGRYGLSKHPPEEAFAVEALVSLAEHNILSRLQVCECGNWFYMKFAHQRFCTTECRKRFWEASEERKEQKRQKARENYLYKKAHPKRTRKEK